jgi:hypothetical protein
MQEAWNQWWHHVINEVLFSIPRPESILSKIIALNSISLTYPQGERDWGDPGCHNSVFRMFAGKIMTRLNLLANIKRNLNPLIRYHESSWNLVKCARDDLQQLAFLPNEIIQLIVFLFSNESSDNCCYELASTIIAFFGTL